MKAIVQNAYGPPDILELKDVDIPKVDENEVLVRVHSTSINAGDMFTLHGSPWLIRLMLGLRRPKDHILGWDIAGVVEEVGKQVTRFQPGDKVYGVADHAFAEYVSTKDDLLAIIPEDLSFDQAAASPTAGLTALEAIEQRGKVQSGQKVLINGASGGVGTFAVQIAKASGAEVTGVCSTAKMEMVRSIGADHVIDYKTDDFTRSEQRYDLILDNAGSHNFSALRHVLKPNGVIMPNTGHGGMWYVIKAYALSPFIRQQAKPWQVTLNHESLQMLTDLIESGKVTPVIDKTFALPEIPQALEYLESGKVKGKIVITILG